MRPTPRIIGATGAKNGRPATFQNTARTAQDGSGRTNGRPAVVLVDSTEKAAHAGANRFSVEAYSVGQMTIRKRRWVVLNG